METEGISIDMERHGSAVMVVMDIFPEMMRDVIINSYPPPIIAQMVQNALSDENHLFTKTLNAKEKHIVSQLAMNGYRECDVSLLYKLIRHFALVKPPTKQWGREPSPGAIDLGDDVERMYRSRNNILHRSKGSLSEHEKDTFFLECEGIAKRVDALLSRPINTFENRIQHVKRHNERRENYIQCLEHCVDLQAQLQNRDKRLHVDLHYGEDIAIRIGHDNVTEPNGVTKCSLYIRDPNIDVSEIVEIIEKIKLKLNEGDVDIKVLGAENKCLLVHIAIKNNCFKTKESLHQDIGSFLWELFTMTSLDKVMRFPVEAVLVESDNTNEMDTIEETYGDVLKLDVAVKDTVFQSHAHLYEQVNELCNEIFNVTNQNIVTNGTSLDVTLTTKRNDDSETSLEIESIRPRLLHLKEELYDWVADINKVVKALIDLAEKLDDHIKRIGKAITSGSTDEILAAVGELTLAAGAIAGTAGVTRTGSNIAEFVLNWWEKAEVILKKYISRVEGLKNECVEIGTILKRHGNMEASFPFWVRFWAKLVIGVWAHENSWEIITNTLKSQFSSSTTGDNVALKEAYKKPITKKYPGSDTAGILLFPIAGFVESSIAFLKTNLNNKRLFEDIRNWIAKLKAECPSETEINIMIENTLSYFY